MLTDIGLPFLRVLDDKVIPRTWRILAGFTRYVTNWRSLLDPLCPCGCLDDWEENAA